MKLMFLCLLMTCGISNAAEVRPEAFLKEMSTEIKNKNYKKAVSKISTRLHQEIGAADEKCFDFFCKQLFDLELSILDSQADAAIATQVTNDFLMYLEKLKQPGKRLDMISVQGVRLVDRIFVVGFFAEGLALAKKLIFRLSGISGPEHASEVASRLIEFNKSMSHHLRWLGRYDEARLAINSGKGNNTSADNRSAYFWLLFESADLYAFTGDYKRAQEEADLADQQVPSRPNQWVNTSWIELLRIHFARSQGNPEKSETLARKALTAVASPDRQVVRVWISHALSMALRRQNKFDEAFKVATETYNEASKVLAPGDVNLYYFLYELYAVSSLRAKPDEAANYKKQLNTLIAGKDLEQSHKEFIRFWEHHAKNDAKAMKNSLEALEKKFGKFQPDYLDLKALSAGN